jgi:hypothetical protein
VAEDPCTATGVVWNRPVGTPDGVTDRPPSLMAEASRRIQASRRQTLQRQRAPAAKRLPSRRRARPVRPDTRRCPNWYAARSRRSSFKDLVALGASARMRELKREVPTALSVVGCDDIPVAAFLGPPLTTVPPPVLTPT